MRLQGLASQELAWYAVTVQGGLHTGAGHAGVHKAHEAHMKQRLDVGQRLSLDVGQRLSRTKDSSGNAEFEDVETRIEQKDTPARCS